MANPSSSSSSFTYHVCRPNEDLENICSKDSPFLVVYGGGSSIQNALSLLSLRISPPSSLSFSPSSPSLPPPLLSLVDQIIDDSKKSHQIWSSNPSFNFARFPPSPLPSSSSFEVSLSLCVFQIPSPPQPHSLFFQGWLFDGELVEEGEGGVRTKREGISRYPLVGLYDPSPSFLSPPPLPSVPTQLPPDCPFNDLSPMDQHAHLTQELLVLDGAELLLENWNFGGEMAKICLNFSEKVGSGFGVCVDLETRRVHVCLLFVCIKGGVGGGGVREVVESCEGRVREVVSYLGLLDSEVLEKFL